VIAPATDAVSISVRDAVPRTGKKAVAIQAQQAAAGFKVERELDRGERHGQPARERDEVRSAQGRLRASFGNLNRTPSLLVFSLFSQH
jgi:hypothetical protein